jgi:hypothetical protein
MGAGKHQIDDVYHLYESLNDAKKNLNPITFIQSLETGAKMISNMPMHFLSDLAPWNNENPHNENFTVPPTYPSSRTAEMGVVLYPNIGSSHYHTSIESVGTIRLGRVYSATSLIPHGVIMWRGHVFKLIDLPFGGAPRTGDITLVVVTATQHMTIQRGGADLVVSDLDSAFGLVANSLRRYQLMCIVLAVRAIPLPPDIIPTYCLTEHVEMQHVTCHGYGYLNTNWNINEQSLPYNARVNHALIRFICIEKSVTINGADPTAVTYELISSAPSLRFQSKAGVTYDFSGDPGRWSARVYVSVSWPRNTPV